MFKDTSYRSAVNTLESVRQNWEEQTTVACNVSMLVSAYNGKPVPN